jgi:2-oxoglutarate dehydrogenase E1 component
MSKGSSGPGDLNLAFVEGLFADYLQDPGSVAEEWRRYFRTLPSENGGSGARPPDAREAGAWLTGPSFRPPGLFEARGAAARADGGQLEKAAGLQGLVDKLVRNYRVRGHIIANLDPLGLPRPSPPELDPAYYGLTQADMGRPVSPRTLSGCSPKTVGEVIECIRNTYCRSIGAQFMHIDDIQVRDWLQERMEGVQNRLRLEREEQIRILTRLTDAVIFEEFIQKKYVGAKSFSLEGSESLIPLLDLAIEKAGEHDIREIVLAMAHRGRLNVLANILGKSPQQIFREFEDVDPELQAGRGDVKYHLGYSGDWRTSRGENIHLSLCFNPSHLEFVNPVAVGRMRAKQDRAHDLERQHGLVILIHGDAAFAAEGIVQETLNMSELEGYRIGGTIHVIVNNQIGFTTPPEQGRSSVYASGLAKMLQVPIFHVNGEDPEAVAQVIRLAMDFRQSFKRDVVIDMYGYRLHGHNEGDEPSFTQPLLYRAIAERKSVREGYLDHLLALDGITREEADLIAEERRKHLEDELSAARSDEYVPREHRYTGIWSGYRGGPDTEVEDTETGVSRDRLEALLEKLSRTPKEFHPHKRLGQLLRQRHEMAEGQRPVDWSAGEALAFATLLSEGLRVRVGGQDSERGTFSHRHAVLRDIEDGYRYVPLEHLTPGQAPFEIVNSPLSENGVLGFEYGYSLDWPDGLVCWEAQFGDFVNAAQVIIDQFLASAEDKWNRLSGLVLLLPHGFEGQGPEHSSARLERFLTIAAEDNIQVAYPTTPAQYFHLLRRQVVRPWRKPLVVMTPKSLLRHPRVVSPLEEFIQGRFERVLADGSVEAAAARRVLLCSGKIYYDLTQARDDKKRSDVAIVRVEQLYPLAPGRLEAALKDYADGTPAFWVQEEPENMGAWRHMRVCFGEKLFGRLPFSGISRPASASPATGSTSSHKLEQQAIVDEAFGD